jgi:hypothetical protein
MVPALVLLAPLALASPQIVDFRVGFGPGVADHGCSGLVRALGRSYPLVFTPSQEGLETARLELSDVARYAWARVSCDGVRIPSTGVVFFHDVRHDTIDYLASADDGTAPSIRRVVLGLDAGRAPGRETIWKLSAGAWGLALILTATRLKPRRKEKTRGPTGRGASS